MGRGRNKAKQTRVARELKYSAPQTDFEALTRELHAQVGQTASITARDDEDNGTDQGR